MRRSLALLYLNPRLTAQQARDIEETDAAILSSELPIEPCLLLEKYIVERRVQQIPFPDLAAAKKKAYLKSYNRKGAESGWHFLTGDAQQLATQLAGREKELLDRFRGTPNSRASTDTDLPASRTCRTASRLNSEVNR